MSDAIQIFPLDEVIERASLAGPKVKSINLYQGHIRDNSQRNVLTYSIRRAENGQWPADQLAYLKRLRGNYTAVVMPGKEFFYVSSHGGLNGLQQDFNFMPYELQQDYPQAGLAEIVQQLLAAQKENARLIQENDQLRDQLAQLETGADKFSYALEKLFYKVAPALGIMQADSAPMQGNKHQHNMANENEGAQDWRAVDLSGQDEAAIESALGVIYLAFGDESVLTFARRLQQNPNLVTSLKAMI